MDLDKSACCSKSARISSQTDLFDLFTSNKLFVLSSLIILLCSALTCIFFCVQRGKYFYCLPIKLLLLDHINYEVVDGIRPKPVVDDFDIIS